MDRQEFGLQPNPEMAGEDRRAMERNPAKWIPARLRDRATN
jgi:hypothetical protein